MVLRNGFVNFLNKLNVQHHFYSVACTIYNRYNVNRLIVLPRVKNKRGECLTLYRPVIDDCAEVKWLPFRVTYRLLVFVHFLTAISLATP